MKCGVMKARFHPAGCGTTFVCDREPGHKGSHRAYDEAHDEVVFWPATPIPGVWQPIETADKELDRPYHERRTIMLFKRAYGYDIVGEGKYLQTQYGAGSCWVARHVWYSVPEGYGGSFTDPTHWMFKPDPPAQEGQ